MRYIDPIRKMEIEIKAINSLIRTGNVANVHSAQSKIDSLKLAIKNAKERQRIFNWLSQ
jgi:hypothetical protein